MRRNLHSSPKNRRSSGIMPRLSHPERSNGVKRHCEVEGSRFSEAGKTPIARRRAKAFASRFRVDNASTCLHHAPTYPHVTVRLNLHPPPPLPVFKNRDQHVVVIGKHIFLCFEYLFCTFFHVFCTFKNTFSVPTKT